jgi:hypothetical protein
MRGSLKGMNCLMSCWLVGFPSMIANTFPCCCCYRYSTLLFLSESSSFSPNISPLFCSLFSSLFSSSFSSSILTPPYPSPSPTISLHTSPTSYLNHPLHSSKSTLIIAKFCPTNTIPLSLLIERTSDREVVEVLRLWL